MKYEKGRYVTDKERKKMSMDEKKKFLLDALRDNYGIVKYATDLLGSSRQTFYDYLNSDEDFKKGYEGIREECTDFVEKKLFEVINEGHTNSIQFYLRTRGKERGYQENMINTNLNKDINITIDGDDDIDIDDSDINDIIE